MLESHSNNKVETKKSAIWPTFYFELNGVITSYYPYRCIQIFDHQRIRPPLILS